MADEPRLTWAAYEDGEIILQISGPDAERIARAVSDRVAYRVNHRPTAENGYTLWGPWIDVE